jgi:hypothetical protein
MTCAVLKYEITNNLNINGVNKLDLDTFTVGSTTVTVNIATGLCLAYSC